MSLFDQVVNESYAYDGTLDSVIEAEIADRITDDPVDLVEYVGECQYGMLALDTAVAVAEGHLSVEFMNARANGDEAAMESICATMEGLVSDAWEKLKEWVKKAYNAIKDFVIKYWNKLRGYVDIFRGMVGKYGDVLRDKDCDAAKVRWPKQLDIQAGAEAYQARLTAFKSELNNLKSNNAAGRDNADGNATTDSAQDVRREMEHAIYGVGAGRGDNSSEHSISTDETTFGAIRRDAIEAADIGGAKKYVDFILNIGNTQMKDALKAIDDAEKLVDDTKNEDYDDDSNASGNFNATTGKPTKSGHTNRLAQARRLVTKMTTVHRTASTVLTAAAKMKVSLAVKACRDALMYHRTKGSGRYKGSEESTSSIDALMATIM
jgi:hypothetical protein